jgi:protein-L-isoaspartate(D-aspartate) O-methyltransferase
LAEKTAPLQRALVEHLRQTGVLTQPAVAQAFLAVPRHLFLPGVPPAEVYRDDAIATKFSGDRPISSSSQPAIMAIMLEQLAAAPGQRVLEIGAGTGFNAALLARLVGPTGHVVSVDIDEDIVAAARQHLAAAGVNNVDVIHADGGHGFAPAAPYDRMILTVGAWDIAPAWHEQLKHGGRLVLPLELGRGPQASIALDKTARDGPPGGPLFVSRSVRECGFMRLRGAFAGPEFDLALGPEPGLHLGLGHDPPATAEALYAWLTGPSRIIASPLAVTAGQVLSGLGLWLGLRAPNLCDVTASDDPGGSGGVPCLLRFNRRTPICLTLGLVGPTGLCLLRREAGSAEDDETPFRLELQCYGPSPEAEAAALEDHLAAWHAAGRPGARGLRLQVYPPDALLPTLPPGGLIVRKRWTQLVVDWPDQLA